MRHSIRSAVLAVAFTLTASVAHAQSISQLVSAGAVQSSDLSVFATGALGGAFASGGQSNLNMLNQAGAGGSPMIVSSPSFLLAQGVDGALSTILQSARNDIQSFSSSPLGNAFSALTGGQTSLNTVNVANLSLAGGGQASFLQNLDLAGPSVLTSTNALSAMSMGGSAGIFGNGNMQSAGVAINSIVLSTPAAARLLVSQSGPVGTLSVTSGNSMLSSGQTGATIGSSSGAIMP